MYINMSSVSNTGAVFVRNYLHREWKHEKKQTYWTLVPNETNLNHVLILYQFADDLEIELFRGLQLIFEVRIHEEHPYKPPSVLVFTPNVRMKLHESICIDGLTAWHPENWRIITTMNSIIERFASAFIDTVNVKTGAGFDYATDEKIAEYVRKSKAWNMEHYPEIVAQFNEQCIIANTVVSEEPAPKPKKPDPTDEDFEYEYSDDDDEEAD